jgi:hypothetical protein
MRYKLQTALNAENKVAAPKQNKEHSIPCMHAIGAARMSVLNVANWLS